jgi:hypothetical protein
MVYGFVMFFFPILQFKNRSKKHAGTPKYFSIDKSIALLFSNPIIDPTDATINKIPGFGDCKIKNAASP